MKFQVKDGFLVDIEDGDRIIAVMSEDSTIEDKRIIELGTDSVEIVENFICKVNSGTFKPRTTVKEFERLLEKHQI